VLVGDPHQLPEIDAGGVLTGLAERLDPIELTENRRQRAQWERDALGELRCGDVDLAFSAYRDNERIVSAPTAIEVRQAMVADWWSYRLAGDSVSMTAYRRDDVDDLNGRARAYLVRSGEVSGPEMVLHDRPYQVGDQIVCLKNNRRLGVCNGTRATIHSVDPERGTLTITADDHRVLLPSGYLDDGNIAHGYATTIHKTQGATFDRGLVLGTDELFCERDYVALSRGRSSNHLYLIGATEIDDSTGHGPPPIAGDPVEAVQQARHRQGEKRLASSAGSVPAARCATCAIGSVSCRWASTDSPPSSTEPRQECRNATGSRSTTPPTQRSSAPSRPTSTTVPSGAEAPQSSSATTSASTCSIDSTVLEF
jgi:ATP-dependent exoDNAse (exonuclease V) alpha subunit